MKNLLIVTILASVFYFAFGITGADAGYYPSYGGYYYQNYDYGYGNYYQPAQPAAMNHQPYFYPSYTPYYGPASYPLDYMVADVLGIVNRYSSLWRFSNYYWW